jgi:hypothetical protein
VHRVHMCDHGTLCNGAQEVLTDISVLSGQRSFTMCVCNVERCPVSSAIFVTVRVAHDQV